MLSICDMLDHLKPVGLAVPLSRVSKADIVRLMSWLLVLLLTACGGDGTTTGPRVENPVPSVTAVSPEEVLAGQDAVTLTVEGAKFVPSSVVRWNGSSRSTTYVDGGTLRAVILPSDLRAGGSASITVSNPPPGGGVSGSLTVSVLNPVPSVAVLSPEEAIAGQDDFTLTVEGANFVASSAVRWNGTTRTTTYVDGGTLQATIPASDVTATGTASITVSNPPPGGGLSGSITVSVVIGTPAATALSPRGTIAGQEELTLTVNGEFFVESSVVRWNGSDRSTTYVDRGTLQATIPASDLSTPGTVPITVSNPPPAGVSGSLTFSVLPRPAGQIAFVSTRDGDREIYLMNADGTDPVNLTNNPALDSNPSWSPDGSRIAFVSDRDGNREIYVMNADGTGQANLTNNPADDWRTGAIDDWAPAWSPDGSKILFSSDRDGNEEIYVMNADGSSQVNLTNRTEDDWRPGWSPDGSRIVWMTAPAPGNWEIYVMTARGTGQANLTNTPASLDGAPAWSPDGSKIAFLSTRDAGLRDEIYVMNADGTNPVNLTNSSNDDIGPAWSPGGSWIAFISRDYSMWALKRINADGTNEVTLGHALPGRPTWSPDGSWIACYSAGDIYLTDADGLVRVNLTNAAGDDFKPRWKPGS